ncbi:MAG TPA: histidine phosphatase family protein [Acidimicrobiales bacterium]|nr:histidine phosphatase family protein [Acidimicrobiales bacterium]
MTRLLLVRHGQSTWNADGRWQGQADPPLSDLGRLQARHAAASVGAVAAIYASHLERARVTAEIIGEELGIGPVIVDERLSERDAGEWSGLTRPEIEAEWPGWIDDGRRPPSWEPNDRLLPRTLAALGRIHDEVGEGDVLVVTHGGLIYTLEEHLGARHRRIGNLEARWVDVEGEDLRLGSRVELVDHAEITVPGQI